jgi:hypothetical protein
MNDTDIAFTAAFLHDTQTALLEGDQREIRAILAGLPEMAESQLPFNLFPPLCPCTVTGTSKKLTIEAPVVSDGWIVRPVPAFAGEQNLIAGGMPHLGSGLPPFPEVTGMILGYAGERAREVLALLDAKAFTVNVWFTAEISVSIHREKGCISSSWTIGTKSWHKR